MLKADDYSLTEEEAQLVIGAIPLQALPRTYTLREIEQLAREFINEQEHSGAYPTGLQLVLSLYVQWLRKREQQQEVGNGR